MWTRGGVRKLAEAQAYIPTFALSFCFMVIRKIAVRLILPLWAILKASLFSFSSGIFLTFQLCFRLGSWNNFVALCGGKLFHSFALTIFFGRMIGYVFLWIRGCGDIVRTSLLLCLQSRSLSGHWDRVLTVLLWLFLYPASFCPYLEIFWMRFGEIRLVYVQQTK